MGIDKNYRSYADVEDVVVQFEAIAPPDGTYADTLKLSHAKNVRVQNCTIVGGLEDCIDANRMCENVLVKECTLVVKGHQGSTLKGGSKNITFEDVEFIGRGKYSEIEIGMWSDQSLEPTTDIILQNVWHQDGKPVRVWVWNGERPIVIGGNVKVTMVPKWIVKTYFWLRKRKLAP